MIWGEVHSGGDNNRGGGNQTKSIESVVRVCECVWTVLSRIDSGTQIETCSIPNWICRLIPWRRLKIPSNFCDNGCQPFNLTMEDVLVCTILFLLLLQNDTSVPFRLFTLHSRKFLQWLDYSALTENASTNKRDDVDFIELAWIIVIPFIILSIIDLP